MEAAYYRKMEDHRIECALCPHRCVIADGKSGICRVRSNRGGTLHADSYGNAVSLAMDPVEKKPLYHFHPGKNILSTGPNGCNFRCGFCQNSGISQQTATVMSLPPQELARIASEEGSIGVAYTYSEPFIWFEYIRDAGAMVRDKGMVNVLVTNGFVNEEPLRELLPVVDALNVDVKSMRPEFYSRVCGGQMEDVLKTVEIAARSCHVEITNLIIPGYNDADQDFDLLVEWIYTVNPSIPLHFSRYFPRYRFTAPETPRETLFRAFSKAKEKLRYVYMGNVPWSEGSDTFCPSCGNRLIGRIGYSVSLSGIHDRRCSQCGAEVEAVGLER